MALSERALAPRKEGSSRGGPLSFGHLPGDDREPHGSAPYALKDRYPRVVPDAERTVLQTLRSLLKRREAEVEVNLSSDLYDDLMLDSLETAELSAALEDDLGRDPYSEELRPRTVAEVIEFYEK